MMHQSLLQDLSLWGCVWQGTVFIALGLMASHLLRHRPSRAYPVLLLAMMAAVAVPLMSAVVTHFELGVFTARATESVSTALEEPEAIPLAGTDDSTEIAVPISVSPAGIHSGPVGTSSVRHSISWRAVLVYAWMIATLALLARLVVTFMYGACIVRNAEASGCEQVQQAVDDVMLELGIPRGLQVHASKHIRSPIVWCWSRPSILLVPNACEDPRVDWAGVVAHELAHCKRWDHISGLIAELMVCLLPWNPIMWLAKKCLVSLGERACDDWVVATGQPCEDYAESLLCFRAQRQMAFLPAVVHSKRGLAGRVNRILQNSCGNPRAGAVWALAVSIGVACLSVGIAFAQARPAKRQNEIQVNVNPAISPHKASVDGANEWLKQLIAKGADRNVPWMHVKYTGYRLDEQGNKTSEEGSYDTEIWYSFKSKLAIQKTPGGSITFRDYARQEVHTYNHVSKRIILSALATDEFLLTESPWTWMARKIHRISSSGGDVMRSEGQYRGKTVDVLEIVSAVKPGRATEHVRIYVDRTSSLPIVEERKYLNSKTNRPELIETGVVYYPGEGPADIYALGLSRDIPTINSLPLPTWDKVRGIYSAYRRRIPAEKYIAIVTDELAIRDHPVESVDIYYADGSRLRHERHMLRARGFVSPQWQEQKADFGGTFESILKWSTTFKARGTISIGIYDRDQILFSKRSGDGTWEPSDFGGRGKRPWAKHDTWSICEIGYLAWPDIRARGDIIQDDYARENQLIRVEAKDKVYYFNPKRDYICQRRIDSSGHISDVTEFYQTDDGHWYPSKIAGRTGGNTIFLKTDTELSDELFDPKNLPK